MRTRTSGCGPARPVVWEGRSETKLAAPYPDPTHRVWAPPGRERRVFDAVVGVPWVGP
jgi:hypothetical protein